MSFLRSAILLTLIATSASAEPNSVVYPTGRFPADVHAVQAAVNQGGEVLLKAVNAAGQPTTFNFGPASGAGGRVRLTADVAVLGETVDGAMTTIAGGNSPFFGFGTAVRSSFRGIDFQGPYIAAVVLVDSAGFEFRDCKVSGVVGFLYAIVPGFPPVFKGQGLWIGPTGLPERVTGAIVIEGNTIEDIRADLGYGLAPVTFSGEMKVSRNTIRGAATAGILLLSNAGPALVEDNYVAPGPSRYPGTFADFGNGIWVDVPLAGSAYIRRNEVVAEHPLADGIILLGVTSFFLGPAPVVNAVVEKNRVTMRDSQFGGISLYGRVLDSYVGQNEVLGTGVFALQAIDTSAGFPPEDHATSNAFVGNNIALFQSTVADVFFDFNSEENTLVGYSGSVIDLGIDNRITGYTKISGGVNLGRLHDVQAAKRAVLQSLRDHEREANPF